MIDIRFDDKFCPLGVLFEPFLHMYNLYFFNNYTQCEHDKFKKQKMGDKIYNARNYSQ